VKYEKLVVGALVVAMVLDLFLRPAMAANEVVIKMTVGSKDAFVN